MAFLLRRMSKLKGWPNRRAYGKKPIVFHGPVLRLAQTLEPKYETEQPKAEEQEESNQMKLPQFIEAKCCDPPGPATDKKGAYNYAYHAYSYYDLVESTAQLAGFKSGESQPEAEKEKAEDEKK